PFDGGAPAGDRSDHTLVELAAPEIGNSFDLHWAGWDRRPPPTNCAAPSDPSATAGLCASIHHPGVDEKRITFVESPMLLGDISSAVGVHWTANWDPTPPLLPNIQPLPASLPPSVTEGGSSGSPLYNAEQRLIGVLSGGASFCGVSADGLNDQYGGLFHAWEGLGTPATRMRDYLDPVGSNPEFIDGIDECTGPTVELSVNNAMAGPGADVIFSAAASGTAGPYTFRWDVDGDGVTDRSGLGLNQLTARYPRTGAVNAQVTVLDAAQCATRSSIALNISGPEPALDGFGAPTQLCGNDDADIDPGERWAVPLNFSNPGSNNALSLVAMLGKNTVGELPGGPDAFGYTYGDSAGGACSFDFIDISAMAELPLVASSEGFPAEDDGRTEDIMLGEFAFEAYGQIIDRVRMSTNGYLSADPSADGGDFNSACGVAPDSDANGVRLNVQHDDMITAGGLRSATFASCPRAAEVGAADQPCVVFQWSGMGLYQQSGVPDGNVDYQAVVYPASRQITYQYREALRDAGGDADVSIYGGPGRSTITYSCKNPVIDAGRAVCFFHPDSQPSSTSLAAVHLETPALELGNLAMGGSTSASASFQIDPDANCGGSFALGYRGAAYEGGFSAGGASQRIDFAAAEQCQVVTDCPAQIAEIDLNDGAFFERSRPGNGLVSHVIPAGPPGQPSTFFGAWYTGERDRSNTWYIVQDFLVDGQVVAPILQFTRDVDSPTWSVSSATVGRAEVTPLDANRMAYYWELNGQAHGEVLDQLFFASGASPGNPDRTGAWFWPPESGWGLTVDSFNDGGVEQDFTIVYYYDDGGVGRWSLGQAFVSNGGPIPAVSFQTHCPGCAWLDIIPTGVGVGTMTR
ncbi:MAG: PKD domain-containing protein, partial [Xanthomonadales bacterium]|nr:PKD domain-containing protein [Xanthomonadales bacterium]